MVTKRARHRGSRQKVSRGPSAGTAVIWPKGARALIGISGPTLWRWERDGKLPPRDVVVAGRAIGWRPETLDAALRSPAAS